MNFLDVFPLYDAAVFFGLMILSVVLPVVTVKIAFSHLVKHTFYDPASTRAWVEEAMEEFTSTYPGLPTEVAIAKYRTVASTVTGTLFFIIAALSAYIAFS